MVVTYFSKKRKKKRKENNLKYNKLKTVVVTFKKKIKNKNSRRPLRAFFAHIDIFPPSMFFPPIKSMSCVPIHFLPTWQ